MYSLLHIYHQATLLCFHKWLLLTRLPDSARVSSISSQYPTWCRSTLESCGHDLNHAFLYPSCSTIQEKVTSNRPDDRFSLEVLMPRVRCQPQLWIRRQFFSTQSIRWRYQTERVKWWTQPDQTQQRALSPTHRRKSCKEDRKDPLLDYPDILWSPRPMRLSSFSCAPPPFVNLGTRFLLRGEGCNTPCYGNSNQGH
jgi:hypothetical protein